MGSLLVLLGKDLRLLWRDRTGLIFLTLAPIVVICVAGFSLANLYGADPTGQTAYEFPVVDEDGGELALEIRTRLGHETAVHFHLVPDRAAAEDLVRRKRSGSALVIPSGTQAALDAGRPASLILYTDAVKYLERINVRMKLLEVRDEIAAGRRASLGADAEQARQRLEEEVARVRSAVERTQGELAQAWDEAKRERDRALAESRASVARSREEAGREIERRVRGELEALSQRVERDVDGQVSRLRDELRAYLDVVEARRRELRAWVEALRTLAGSHAAEIPPPPEFPELPAGLAALLSGERAAVTLPPVPEVRITLPPAPRLEAPPLPAPPAIEVPRLEIPEMPKPPASLSIEEVNLSGGSPTINTFDQNVPGFSVTFLLLGMLLGVSLGLLDERDWGTFDRLRAMPITAANVLVGKLLSRFVVGVAQMIALLAIGWLAFGVSLGPQPWALLLPTLGIVFAGTAFGLVVAAVAPTREAVLPVGSIVIVTMAAVGGCWWPIDLEPRWMRSVALAFPTTWAMDAFNDLMIRRRGFEAALAPTAVMLAYGLAYLTIGVLLFRRKA
ncbi:MAG TPA: ABC transporter permease [Candidatus Dormibacteraeota bacterium]|nr:ABC transporter permease [Candidatus Dormibacteraeota bacterium]